MKRIMNFTLRRPVLVLIAILALSVYFFMEMKNNTQMETDLDEYMPQDHPAFVYSDSAEAIFNIKDAIIIAIENKNGIYNSQTLEKITKLTRDLQKMEEIEKSDVTSLYTADNIIGTEMGLEVNPFYTKAPELKEALEQLRKNVRD